MNVEGRLLPVPLNPEAGLARRQGGFQHVDMGVEVEQLPGRLQEPHGAGGHASAVKVRLEVELQGPLGAAGVLSEELREQGSGLALTLDGGRPR